MATRAKPASGPNNRQRPSVTKKFANRVVSKAQRIDVRGKGGHRSSEINEAEAQIRATGLHRKIEAKLGRRKDAVKRLSILTLMVGIQLAAAETGHRAQIKQIVQAINKIPHWRLAQLGSPDWTETGSYDRVQRLYKQMAAAIEEGWIHTPDDNSPAVEIDLEYYQTQVLLSDIPRSCIRGAAIAIDGTAMETCANFQSTKGLIEIDGDFSKSGDEAVDYVRRAEEAPTAKKAKVLGVGEDGRNIYTRDTEARAGYRTATKKKKGGPYIGRELHAGVTAPPIKNTNGADKITFYDDYPNIVGFISLVEAGAHRGESVLPGLIRARDDGHCTEVIADAGYSLQEKRFALPLRKEGIPLTFRPASYQLGVNAFGELITIDGYPFADYTPQTLQELKPPGYGATTEQREELTKEFDARAIYRYSTHGTPKDGVQRLISPLASGKIRTRSVGKSMRKAPNAPIARLPNGTVDKTTISIGVDELLTMQRTAPFTTAHNRAYGRRQLAETVNSRIKGGASSLTDIEKGYTLLMNTAKIGVFLAHTISQVNQIEYRNYIRNRQAYEQANGGSGRKPRSDRVKRSSDLEAHIPADYADP